MTYDVFISYSSADKPTADAVCAALEASGTRCWIAPRDIVPGTDWSAAIIAALNVCRLFVLVLTEASNRSPQVKREVERVVHRDVPIVALRLENVMLTPALEYFISASHWLDATGGSLEGPLAQLTEAARRLLQADSAAAFAVSAAPAAPAPPAPSLAVTKGFLPATVTSFVGRAREVADVNALLQGEARLVTLTGAGGIGKTRLALRAASEQAAQYPGGQWWVDLAPLRDPSLVLPAIASAVGVREQSSATLPAQIAARFTAPTLLLLDNFEQVAEAAGEIDALLRAGPFLTLLVTSRAPLNLSGEFEFAVPELDDEAARALFTARAQQIKAGFALDDKSRPILARICRRLDGIPLAIELAAAQIKMLPLPQIEKQLDQRFRVLVSPHKDVTQRQRTLRATIEWSYNLLSEPERRLLATLAVFPAQFTLEDAEAVCASDATEEAQSSAAVEEDEPDVYFGLARLREQSLLRVIDGEDVPHFLMLESVRAFGQEQLRTAGRLDAAANRHADVYAGIAARFGQSLTANGDADALATLAVQADNLRAAIDHYQARGRANEAAALCVHLGEFWERQGWLREGRDWLERCLKWESILDTPALRAALLNAAGWLAYLQADYAAANAHTKRALEVSEQAGLPEAESVACNNLALLAQTQNRPDEALTLLQRSLDAARSLGDARKRAGRLSNLGVLEAALGNFAAAQQHLEEAHAIYEQRGDTRGLAGGLCNLSDLALRREQWNEAEVFAARSLACFRELGASGDQMGIACALANLAESGARQSHYEAAEIALDEALTICAQSDLRWLLPLLLETQARNRFGGGNARAAALALGLAEQLRQRTQCLRDPRQMEEIDRLEAQIVLALRESGQDHFMPDIHARIVALTVEALVALVLTTRNVSEQETADAAGETKTAGERGAG